MEEGVIFSEDEYTELITRKLDAKLNKFSNDIQRDNVILLGQGWMNRILNII